MPKHTATYKVCRLKLYIIIVFTKTKLICVHFMMKR